MLKRLPDRQNFNQQNSNQQNSNQQKSNQQNSNQQKSNQQNSNQQKSNQQNFIQQNSNHSNSNQQLSKYYKQRGAAYIRVSTEDQIEFSPDSQLKKIREYAAGKNILLSEDYIFLDEGVSGRYAKKRPAFMKMIGLAKQKPRPFDVILVWKFSRFARSRQDSILYKSMLRKECGIDVISITEQLSEDPTSILVEALLEAMDEYYSINLAQEVKRGMNEKFSRGGVVSVPPFGYRMEEGHFVIDEEKGAIVSRIYEDYLLGMSIRQIATNLNAMGIRTNRGNLFENRTVEYILSNPTYVGKLRRRDDLDGRKKTSSGEWDSRKKSCIGVKSDNGEDSIQKQYNYCDRYYNNPNIRIVEGEHEAIVSEEVFEAVQQRIAENKRASPGYIQRDKCIQQNRYNLHAQDGHFYHTIVERTKAKYMLQGLVQCSNCGAVLTRTERGKALQCNRYMKGKCTVSHYIRLETLNQMVLAKVVRDWGKIVVEIAIPDALKSKNEVKWKGERDVDEKSKQEMKAVLIKQDWIQHRVDLEYKKLERLKEAYMEGIDTLEEYRKSKKEIENWIQALKNERERQLEMEENGEKMWRNMGIENIDNKEVDEGSENENKKSIDKNEYDSCVKKWKSKSAYTLSAVIDSLQVLRDSKIQRCENDKTDKDNKNDKYDKIDKAFENNGEVSLHLLLSSILDKIIFNRKKGTVELFYKI
ncbi:MAG: recombinase family protein [Clostridiales bacterium]|nr:recombinase family protein [Clostridiales bacterium]